MSAPSTTPGVVDRGTVIDRYELVLERGGDGFATTWGARTTDRMARPIEIEIVDPYVAQVSEFREAFLREGAALRRVSHAGFVGWLSTGALAGCLIGVRNPLDTVPLTDLLAAARASNEPLPAGVVLRLAVEMVSTIGAIHLAGRGSIHGDLTPGSVHLTRDGAVVVVQTGLGVAASRADVVRPPRRNERIAYKAPEQVKPPAATARALEGSVDLFSVGAILWEALANRALFEGASDREVIERILAAPAPPLSAVREAPMPVGLGAVVARTLAPDPDNRPRDTGELLASLKAIGGCASAAELAEVVDRHVGPLLRERAAALAAAGLAPPAPTPPAPAPAPTRQQAITVPLGPAAARAAAAARVDAAPGVEPPPVAPAQLVAPPSPAEPAPAVGPSPGAGVALAARPMRPDLPERSPLKDEDLTPVARPSAPQAARPAPSPPKPSVSEPPAAQYVAPQELPKPTAPLEQQPDAKVVLNLPVAPVATVGAAEVAAARARRRTATVKVTRGPELDALLAGRPPPGSDPGGVAGEIDVDLGGMAGGPAAAPDVAPAMARAPFPAGPPYGAPLAPAGGGAKGTVIAVAAILVLAFAIAAGLLMMR